MSIYFLTLKDCKTIIDCYRLHNTFVTNTENSELMIFPIKTKCKSLKKLNLKLTLNKL